LVVTISDWVDMVSVIQWLWLNMWLEFRCPNRSSNKAVDKNQLHNAHSTPDEGWAEKTSFKVDILGDSSHPRNISLVSPGP
jgi:hypothetical protein